MIVKVFLESAGNFEERELLLKFFEGMKNVSTKIEDFCPLIDINHHYTDCDVAVILGSWKNRDRDHHAVRNSIVENSKCFVVIETPLLNRVVGSTNTHHRIGVNGFLNNHGKFYLSNNPGDRREDLGIRWKGWNHNKDGHILLMLQLPGDASLRGINIYDWTKQTISRIRKYSNKKIVIRTHPAHNLKDTDEFYKFAYELLVKNLNIEFSLGNEKLINEDLEKAYCTVAYTSGSSIDSIIAGIPVLTADPGNFAFEISSNYLEDIENLKLAPADIVEQWINNLTYSQWSVDEIKRGDAWIHLMPIAKNVIESLPQPKKKK